MNLNHLGLFLLMAKSAAVLLFTLLLLFAFTVLSAVAWTKIEELLGDGTGIVFGVGMMATTLVILTLTGLCLAWMLPR